MDTLSLRGAFSASRLVELPDQCFDEGYTPEQERYQNIEEEVLTRTFTAVMPAIAAAFVKAAADVLARDRSVAKANRYQ